MLMLCPWRFYWFILAEQPMCAASWQGHFSFGSEKEQERA